VAITPEDHPRRAWVLSQLGNLLLTRFDQIGGLPDLDQAIDAGRKAVTAAKDGGYSELTNLGVALRTRFERTGDLADLNESIDACNKAVTRISATYLEHSLCKSNLGLALWKRHGRTGDLEDLRRAVSVLRDASKAIPTDHPSRAGISSNLGLALKDMFDRTGQLEVLNEAVSFLQASAAAALNANFSRSKVLNNLAGALYIRYERTGNLCDLDYAIEAGRQSRGVNLVSALKSRFERTGNFADLNEAIAFGREILAADPIGLPARGLHLGMLGNALIAQFEHIGDRALLEEAISVDREAVTATPADQPDRAVRLQALGMALRYRFIFTGDQSSLDEAIDVGRAAITAAPPGHVMIGSLRGTLAFSLMARFRSTGDTASLEECVQASRAAVAVTLAEDAGRPGRLANLGSGLHALFRRMGRMNDLYEAISVLREADATLPDSHTKRPEIQARLATALVTLYVKTQDLGTLNEALAIDRRALTNTPRESLAWGARFHSISVDLWRRYVHTKSLVDLTEALQTDRQAVEAVPADDPSRAVYLSLLGYILWAQYRHTKSTHYANDALNVFREAATNEVARVGVRVSAASGWGYHAAALKDWEQAVKAYSTAMNLLPILAGLQLGRDDQEYQLGDETDLATDGAASALNLGRPDLALGLLEQGRGVLFSQALETRSDLTELRQFHPSIADELLRLNRSLAASASTEPDETLGVPDSETPTMRQQPLPDRHQLVHERNRVVAEIRDLPGFERFQLPPHLDQLLAAGQQGPVICCNVSSVRSDALIVSADGIQVVSLPEVTPERVRASVNKLLTATSEAGLASNERELVQAQHPLDDVLRWLWDALAQPVLDRLGFSDAPQPGLPWPRMWWMPTGLLAFLPIHAAGYHTSSDDSVPMTVMDRAISSYAPTIRALLRAREQATPSQPPQALVVSMPTTPGVRGLLPAAKEEARILQSHVRRAQVLSGREATRDRILTELPAFSWVHFACHAASDLDDPSRSYLIVHDHEQRPLTTLDIAQVRLTEPELAFLSACETARTGFRLADESIHLASAFQLAGYPHVIGTLWPIIDYTAAKIAGDFYARVNRQGSPNNQPRDFAEALHGAVRSIRDSHHSSPSLWAAHVHVGC
jgi:hypothetical protein